MNENTKKREYPAIGPSELRQDPVSGEWVVIATGRARRPHDFASAKEKKDLQPRDACPFEVLFPDARSVYALGDDGRDDDWFVQAVPNKYPAFVEGVCPVLREIGPYRAIDGIGFHEVVITRDHERSIGAMTAAETELILRVYQDRFLAIKKDLCVRYISVFHNQGPEAGATIAHPHSQIIATPVVPPDIGRSIAGSGAYFQTHNICVHCATIAYERRAGERVVYENEHALVLAPFASKTAFELRVLPLRHEAYFEAAEASVRLGVADALTVALARISEGLGDPDYNFFLHTAPVGEANRFGHYHWHIEIIPKTAVWAGFEIGTGIEISTIAPEDAASFLRDITV
ncbi:MAG: Uncharacterized protein Greene071436_167 [Parcubacteria group bacterium Greene0714_36]|nr:MAG: Uncharacterized protein Greene071436_167 [Parcubacteria group bacterium Greene0714_36]